ncbi:hypothetical protein HDV00_000576 [Rhizophlyctis rosea]|nr:hypothetical protein HDV00_000576 [Rhizophlyctis rosea]
MRFNDITCDVLVGGLPTSEHRRREHQDSKGPTVKCLIEAFDHSQFAIRLVNNVLDRHSDLSFVASVTIGRLKGYNRGSILAWRILPYRDTVIIKGRSVGRRTIRPLMFRVPTALIEQGIIPKADEINVEIFRGALDLDADARATTSDEENEDENEAMWTRFKQLSHTKQTVTARQVAFWPEMRLLFPSVPKLT